LDIKTAFLNAVMEQGDQEDILVGRPPALFTEKGYMARDVFFLPTKAVYGLRRSPRLWGNCRDETMEDLEVQAETEEKKERSFHLLPLQAEPNLWRVLERGDETQKVWGLVMTYVDDIFICSSSTVLEALKRKFQETWMTPKPEHVSGEPIRFLGMEVSKRAEEGGKEVWYVTQKSYIKDMVEKSEEKVKERKIPVTRDQAHIEEPSSPPTIDQVRGAQKCIGEVLWLLTRSRPDLMYGVGRMGSNVLRNRVKVMELGELMKGYLNRTAEEGLRYEVEFNEEINLQAYSDASLSPEGAESHGSFLILLEGSPIFWRAGRQSMVTLSTAESEMTEVIEAMTAGESVAVIVQELYPLVTKTAYTDSQAAEAILNCDGGSWRTRHLRLRSAFARQSIAKGEWALQHVPGDQMLADLGTKALNAPRLEKLKGLMSMGTIKEEEKEDEIKERKDEEKEGKETVNWAEAAQAVRLITMAAAISTAKAVEEEEKKDGEGFTFEGMVVCYTVFVVLATLLAKRIWMVGVHLVRTIAQRRPVLQGGSLPGKAAREERKEEKKEGKRGGKRGGKTMEGSLVSSHGECSTSSLSSSTSMSSFAAPLPKVMPVQKGAPRPKGAPKVKRLPKRGHQSSEIPTPRVQQPKASSSSHMPTVEEDIFGSWDEIEREERLIRRAACCTSWRPHFGFN